MKSALAGAAASEITATLSGDLSDLAPLLERALPRPDLTPAELTGRIDAQVLLTGSLEEPDLAAEVHVRNGTVAVGSFSPAENLELDVTYDMKALRLERLGGTWKRTTIDGRGDLPVALLADLVPAWLPRSSSEPSGVRLTLTADAITVDTLTPFIDPASLADLDVQVSAQLDIEADGLEMEQVRGNFRVSELDLTVAGVPINQRRETRVDLLDGQVHV